MPEPRTEPATADIDAIRRFSRFYTRRIGVLHEGLLGSPLSLAEGRVLYEIATRTAATARELADVLDLDAGYLSRILRGFETSGLLTRTPAPTDARHNLLCLTAAGQTAFAAIDQRSRAEVGRMLAGLAPAARQRVVKAMADIEAGLGPNAGQPPPVKLRAHRPGDIGWIVHRHGVLYASEYGWDQTFEAMVARVAADFIDQFKPDRERCFVAECAGKIVGSAFVVWKSDAVAKLRLVYVEPEMRGSGLGRRLLAAAKAFARKAGYRRMTLWTNDVLVAARGLYETGGFTLVASAPYRGFGHDLVGETWERDL